MMLRRQQVLRVLASLVLLVVAGFFAAFIRNGLSQRHPQNALPVMQLSYTTSEGTTILPATSVRMDTYDWRFMFWRKEGGGKDLELWREIPASWVAPNSTLTLWFTFDPKSYRVYIKAEESDWTDMGGGTGNNGTLVMPGPPQVTEYTLRVEANWGNGKDATYYAKVQVDAW